MTTHTLTAATPAGPQTVVIDLGLVDDRARLEMRFEDGRQASAAEGDYFTSLLQIRRELEPAGIRILCQGARRDVWPSGMAIDMSAGLKAYVLERGQHDSRPALVDVFDPADDAEVGSIADQEAYRDAWFAEGVAHRQSLDIRRR